MAAFKKFTILVLLVVFIATTFLATPNRVQAAVTTINVNTTVDENNTTPAKCSLREAIIAANTNKAYGGCPAGSGTADVIDLPTGQYVLSLSGSDEAGQKGDLDITEGVTIQGEGLTTVVMGANGWADRIFHVNTTKGTVVLQYMKISNGNASLFDKGGGAILNDAGSNLYINRVFIGGNNAGIRLGGGIANMSTARLTIRGSTITRNTALDGSGIYNGGTLVMANSLLSSNTNSNQGGGLDNAPLQTDDGIDKGAVISNSTITQNDAIEGAGIYNSGPLTLTYDTIVNNTTGEGLLMKSGSSVTYQYTIIAYQEVINNTSLNCAYDGDVTVDSKDSLEDNHSCRLSVNRGDMIDTSPELVLNSQHQPDLADNGGPTQTIALLPDSPAVDAIPTGASGCPVDDQRFYKRGADGDEDGDSGCDIGAYEVDGIINNLYAPFVGR